MYLLEVYVTNANLNVNKPFTYLSDNAVDKYVRVKVSFHHSDNIALVSNCTYTDLTIEQLENKFGYKLLKIKDVIDDSPIISDEIQPHHCT